ncbi:MAG: hypothetical protein OEW21_00180 [Betaproteobacteria bacterium]|nr:hypothetical protein [Betaproteobacteria bacterium]
MTVCATASPQSAAWQSVLDRHTDLFSDTAQGASVALLPRFVRGADGRQRSTVMPVSDGVPMLLWLREPGAMYARDAEFRGLKGLVSDLLLIAGDGTLDAALRHEHPFGELKRQLRSGQMLFMVMRTRDELRERGWSDFIESLGLPFLGTCR